MIEFLDQIDKDFFLFLNGKHSPVWDSIMLFITNKYTWIPFYAVLVGLILYQFKRKGALIIVGVILSVVASDLTASGFAKPYFQRHRPSHSTEISHLTHVPGKKGGKFGFFSSHAANSFAIATFIFFVYRERKYIRLMFLWAAIVAYSRIAVGLHYPGDILMGAITGMYFAYVFYRLYRYAEKRMLLEEV